MAKKFGDSERYVLSLFKKGATFYYKEEEYVVDFADKPTCPKGEPKTDIFVAVKKVSTNEDLCIKISFKQKNAQFLENKTSAKRAEQLFGVEWQNIIMNSVSKIKDKLPTRNLIYKKKKGNTREGSITLGWKFEILTVANRELSGKILVPQDMVKDIIKDVYSGTSISEEKRNAYVCGRNIENSGLANTIIFSDVTESDTIQSIIDKLVSIDEFIDKHPNIYFACTALNYRMLEDKWDGKRPLCIYIDWNIDNNKLTPNFILNNPLKADGNEIGNKLKTCLKELNIKEPADINSSNISDISYLYE